MWGTAGEIKTNSLATFSYGLLHVDIAVLADQLSSDTECYQEDGWWESVKVLKSIDDDDNDRFYKNVVIYV